MFCDLIGEEVPQMETQKTQVQKIIELVKFLVEVCVECGQGVAVTTEKLCGVCDAKRNIENGSQNSNQF